MAPGTAIHHAVDDDRQVALGAAALGNGGTDAGGAAGDQHALGGGIGLGHGFCG
jgi:hypothetical protein